MHYFAESCEQNPERDMILEVSVTTGGYLKYCHVGREWWVLAPGIKRATVGLLSKVGPSLFSHADNYSFKEQSSRLEVQVHQSNLSIVNY